MAVVFPHVALKHREHLAIVDTPMKRETLLAGVVVRRGWHPTA
jgi:hypothetical protein